MKHNGFTLVEMMAVIVLIALLAVIGVATYTNVNESAKEKTLESKKEQIRTAGIKWAKENNISNKTIISVNALVVEGYLTAEENEVGKIGVIENPVTGENMICNTVDISFKDGEYIAVLNDTEQNCTLATQTLVDTNINIKVVDESNIDRTGSGSIAAWTNKNVMIIVSSSNYDSRMTSISYDFEGNTVTKPKSGLQKYTGNAYLSEAAAANYYNVFHVNGALLLNTKIVVTYNIAGENSKSRAYTIRIDKEEASASVSSNSDWLTVDKDVYITVDDGKGSGPKYFYITKAPTETLSSANRYNGGYKTKVEGLEVGKYYVWTEDVAGNKSTTYKVILELNNVDKTIPACEVLFHGHEGNHGWYKEVPVTPGAKNTVKAGLSGMNIGVNTTQNDPEYTAFAQYDTFNEALGTTRTTETTRAGINYYCHVKTLAGNYANASRNLKLDMTPPTITIATTSDTNYTQHKSIAVTTSDSLSGLEGMLKLRYGWGLNGAAPTAWTTDIINLTPNRSSFTMYFTGTASMTGKYTLYIDYSEVVDVAGNHATGVNGSGSGGIASFGPYYFDNTPPVCDGNNGKTTWTSGGYTINQLCADNDGTNDQSGCKKRTYTTRYYAFQNVMGDQVTIEDKAGNTTVCDYNVYIDNVKPTCSLSPSTTDWTNKDVVMTLSATDNFSGIPTEFPPFTWQFPFSNGGATTSTGWTSQTTRQVGYNGNVTVTIRDRAKNENTCSYNISNIDKEPPTCTGTINGYDQVTGISYTVTCNDTGSGCASGAGTFGPYKPVATNETHSYSVTDRAGNSAGCGTIYVWGQKQAQARACSSPKRCKDAGCETWNTCVHSSCGVYRYNSCQNSACGTTTVTVPKTCYDTYCWDANQNWCDGPSSTCTCQTTPYSCDTTKEVIATCRTSACGVESYNSCATSACGCNTYKASCGTCGCNAYDTIVTSWHDENFCGASTTNCNLTECRWVFRASKQ